MTTRRFQSPVLFGACVLWALTATAGLIRLWAYAETPGPAATASNRWPAASHLAHDRQRPTLVVFAHPQCACSRATVAELSRLMAHVQNRATVYVVVYRPSTAPQTWERTDLWRSAAAIPGVRVLSDDDGAEAARFGASVSGQTLLYGSDGRLLFGGGITYARGHEGDNAGLGAVESLLLNGRADTDRTPVFGCAIHEKARSAE